MAANMIFCHQGCIHFDAFLLLFLNFNSRNTPPRTIPPAAFFLFVFAAFVCPLLVHHLLVCLVFVGLHPFMLDYIDLCWASSLSDLLCSVPFLVLHSDIFQFELAV